MYKISAPARHSLEKYENFNLNVLTFISLTPVDKLFNQFIEVEGKSWELYVQTLYALKRFDESITKF